MKFEHINVREYDSPEAAQDAVGRRFSDMISQLLAATREECVDYGDAGQLALLHNKLADALNTFNGVK